MPMKLFEEFKTQYKIGGFTQKLLLLNVAVYIVSIVFFYDFGLKEFTYPNWLSLSSDANILLRNPWTIVTYSFFHSSFLHLLFNMMVLHFSGKLFLGYFSPKQLLGVYLLGAIFAGLLFVGVFQLMGRYPSVIGASGAIMAILVATAAYHPQMQLRLALIGNVKLWHIAAVFLGIDLLLLFAENNGGHIAHLAGALFGFVFVKLLQNGTDLTTGISFIFDTLAHLFGRKEKTPFKKVHRNYDRKPQKTVPKIVVKDKTQQQIDDILDKISRSGYDSLTAAEKEFLFKAGKQ